MKDVELGEFIPQKRPHYHRRGHGVYFMISRRPALELSAREITLFDSIDGCRNVAELERIHSGATERLKSWYDAALLELIPPITLPVGPHLVVIEPHMDDAALWAGGRLLHRRGKNRITILSVVKWSNSTSYLTGDQGAFSVEEVSRLRQEESALVARVLGADYRCLEWSDALLRVVPPNSWSKTVAEHFANRPGVFVKFFPDPAEVSLLAEQLHDAMTQLRPDELWIPMGLEEHVDHRTTRNACLRMLAESPEAFKGVCVDMYEDRPHIWAKSFGQDQQIRLAMAARGTRLLPMREEIGDVFGEKIRIATMYASQFKPSDVEPVLREVAKPAGKEQQFAEAFHRLEGPVSAPRESNMCREARGLTALRARTAQWLQDGHRPRRLTIVATPSGHSGLWGNDTKFLLANFPDIDLKFYVIGKCASQIWNEEMNLKVLRRGTWLGAAFGEFFRFGCPVLVLWRGAYGVGLQRSFRAPTAIAVKGAHGLLRFLLPFRDVLFAKSLSELCGVLAESMESNERFERPSTLSEARLEEGVLRGPAEAIPS